MMNLARVLITTGFLLILAGGVLLLLNRMNVPLGRLPGDILIQRKNSTFYVPVATCLLLSIAGSLLLWLFNRR